MSSLPMQVHISIHVCCSYEISTCCCCLSEALHTNQYHNLNYVRPVYTDFVGQALSQKPKIACFRLATIEHNATPYLWLGFSLHENMFKPLL